MKKSHIILIAIAVLAGLFFAANYAYKAQQAAKEAELVAQNRAALEKPHSPQLGNRHAKVTMVEFFDPACATCRLFHPYVKNLLQQYDGKVKLIMRYNPLHQGSDYAITMLQAAKKQGQFWDVLELMYATQGAWVTDHQVQPEKLWQYLDQYKFDTARFKQAMNNPEFAEVIAMDLADAKALGANKTPTYFVNGQPLPSFGLEQLRALVAAEVAKNY